MKKNIYTIALVLATVPLWAQVPNAGFENWDSLTILNNVRIYNPAEWSSSNIDRVDFNSPQTVEMTTDAHTGNYAVKLTSAIDDNQEQATYLATGYVGEGPNDPAADKFPLNGRINGFEGYYKYYPNGADQFRIFLALYRNGQYLGQSFMDLPTAADTYTKFTWQVNYPSTITPPDSAKFIISPSTFDDSEGSVLFLDDLSITYGFSSGINETEQKPSITLYPNPATNEITLFGYDPRHHYVFSLSAMDGKQIQSGKLTNGKLSIESLENGLYFITLIDEDGRTSQLKFAKYQ